MDDWLQWVLAAVAFAVTLAVRAEVARIFLAAGAVGILYYGSLFRAASAHDVVAAARVPFVAAVGGDVPLSAAG
jgi:chromate transporter